MDFIFDNDRPIYIQLVEQLRMKILSGELRQGEKIPSVRDLALRAKVNPNTMQKALTELEREGLIYTERTNGKYVTDDEDVIKKLKAKIIYEKLDGFLSDMKNIGVDIQEINEYLNLKERDEDI